jgi:hypothetical protein
MTRRIEGAGGRHLGMLGHAWSGGDGPASHTYPTGPNATERILDLLLSQ